MAITELTASPTHGRNADFRWPADMRSRLGKEVFRATHDLHLDPMFSDTGLAELLDSYPRERLGIYRFPERAGEDADAEHGTAPDLSGAELLEAVQRGRVWFNLRAVNREVPTHTGLTERVFGPLRDAAGTRTLKEDVGVLISSPGIHVHYHLDIPLVCLVQLRGRKTLHVYPPEAPFVDAEELSAMVLRESDERMSYRAEFDARARAEELAPGDALTWPQTAPHRVTNGPMLNVSLSCEFMTPAAILRANAMHADAALRGRTLPAAGRALSVGTLGRAVAARGLKRLRPPPERAPVPVTFALRADGATETLETAPRGRTCAVLRPSELRERDRRDWTALARETSPVESPLLLPEFADVVARTRDDVRCLLVRDGERLVGVLAAHERGLGLLRPVGAPFSDYSGPLAAEGFDLTPEDFLRLSDYSAFRSSTVLAEGGGEGSFVIHLGELGADAYLEARRSEHSKRFKNFRRLLAKLERERGELRFVHGPAAPDHLDALLAWKREQFRTDALLDLTTAGHAAPLLREVAALAPDAPLTGFLTGLTVEGRLVAGHFGIRGGKSFHPWVAAFDPELADYSPGSLLLHRVLENMEAMGLRTYDLAGGHEGYKKYFSSTSRPTETVAVYADTWAGRLHRTGYGAWDLLGAGDGTGPAARMRRRFDHIGISEPRLLRRVSGAAYALRRIGRNTAA